MILFFISLIGIAAAVVIYILTSKPKKKGLSGEEMFDKITEVQKVADATGQTQRIMWPDGTVRVVDPRPEKRSEKYRKWVMKLNKIQAEVDETGKEREVIFEDGDIITIRPNKKENTLEHLPFPTTIQSDTYRRSDNDTNDALGFMMAASLFDSSSNDSSPSSNSNDDFGGFSGGDFGGGGAEGSWSND